MCFVHISPNFQILKNLLIFSMVSTLIFVSRYSMTLKASQTKIIKEKYLTWAIFIVTFVNYLIPLTLQFLIFNNLLNHQPFMPPCILSHGTIPLKPLIIVLGLGAFKGGVSLYFDIKMLNFVKRRSQNINLHLIKARERDKIFLTYF